MNLLRSKLSMPRVGHGLVPRPRVAELFATTEATRLVVLSAPPGFGKTSAVIDWLQQDGRTAAWLSLDEADNDAGRALPCSGHRWRDTTRRSGACRRSRP